MNALLQKARSLKLDRVSALTAKGSRLEGLAIEPNACT